MRCVIALAAALSGLGAHCPAPPPPVPVSRVYFDSGAAVRIRLRTNAEIRGTLFTGSAPGALTLTVCEEPRSSCSPLDGGSVRTVPISAITELRYRSDAASPVAVAGLYVGLLAGFATDSMTEEWIVPVTGVAGLGLGWLLGSAITTWPIVASRDGGGRLLWSQGPMIIPAPPARHDFLTGCSRGDSLPRSDLVAVARWTRGAFHTDVRRAWHVDSTAGRLVPVSTEGIRCRNQSAFVATPADALRAPAESASAALRFTASPGKARLYLYHVNAFILDPFVVTLDHEIVGPIRYDRYVTTEVDPGLHRVGALGVSDSLTFNTRADSVYFIKLMPGSWELTGTPLALEVVDAVQGRKMILGADLMPPSNADAP